MRAQHIGQSTNFPAQENGQLQRKKEPRPKPGRAGDAVPGGNVAGAGFEPATSRVWAWRATGLPYPAI